MCVHVDLCVCVCVCVVGIKAQSFNLELGWRTGGSKTSLLSPHNVVLINMNVNNQLPIYTSSCCKSNIHFPFSYVFGLHQLEREISGNLATKLSTVFTS